jgi:thioredoxin-related protein
MKSIIAFAFSLLMLANVHAQAPATTPSPTGDPEPSSREWERILPLATNLQADGAKAKAAKKPILLFFNLEGCHFCRFSLRTTIVPLYRDKGWRDALEFRQVTIDDGKSLIDFDGKKISNEDFAKIRKGNFTPTVMMVDGDGKLLGEPLVGIANFDYYSYNVDTLIKAAIEAAKKR